MIENHNKQSIKRSGTDHSNSGDCSSTKIIRVDDGNNNSQSGDKNNHSGENNNLLGDNNSRGGDNDNQSGDNNKKIKGNNNHFSDNDYHRDNNQNDAPEPDLTVSSSEQAVDD